MKNVQATQRLHAVLSRARKQAVFSLELKFLLGVLSCWMCAAILPAQVITTVAGAGYVLPTTSLPALMVPLGEPDALAVDATGNLFVADDAFDVIMKISPEGTLSIVAGNGFFSFSGDGGPATSAALNVPKGIAVDNSGNLYIADTGNNCVRKVSPDGTITTIAGNGVAAGGYSGDGGPATQATLNAPTGVAVDSAGNVYIADSKNSSVRKISSAGIITTIAGTGRQGYSGDGGLAIAAALYSPYAIAVDNNGNIYVSDIVFLDVRKITPDGRIQTLVGYPLPAAGAPLSTPNALAVDSTGNLYVANPGYENVLTVNSSGVARVVVGKGKVGYSGDGGPATNAILNSPYGIAIDSGGNLFVADTFNERIRKVSPSGVIATIAGNGFFSFSGDGGPASSAELAAPIDVALDPAGNLYIAEELSERIRKVSPDGIINTIAGSGKGGFSGDGGPATSATLLFPTGVTIDAQGNLLIADYGNYVIRRVSPTGIITTVAGIGGSGGFSGDGGPATAAQLNSPLRVAVDSKGNLFVADLFNNRIRMINSRGVISTVAGNGAAAYSGDGVPATQAALNAPAAVVVDNSGNLFIADSGNNRVRKVTPDGTISTIAGNGIAASSGDGGPAIAASLLNLTAMTMDANGNLFIAEGVGAGGNRIRRISPDGLITTVAGGSPFHGNGDGGLATQAGLDNPNGLALDHAGDLFIAETSTGVIREVLTQPPVIRVSATSLSFSGQSSGASAPTQSVSIVAAIPGVAFSMEVTGGNWLTVSPASGITPQLVDVTADPFNLMPGQYQATIVINSAYASPKVTTINVSFTVTPGANPTLASDQMSLSFPLSKASVARSASLLIFNTGGGTLNFSATAGTNAGANWLSVSPALGAALPAVPATLTVTANPSGLSPGTYTGQITVASSFGSLTVPVTMTISALTQAIQLSQSGLSFTAVAQGGVVPPQTFSVLNIGAGVVSWHVQTSTLSGGSGWLQATPANGSTDAAAQSSPTVTVSVNEAGLAPGKYYGQVRVDSPGAANTPQVLTVFLQVLPSNASVGAVLQPAELLFTTGPGSAAPSSQSFLVYNTTPTPKSYRGSISGGEGLVLSASPGNATVDPQRPTRIAVQPETTFFGPLAPGVYHGNVNLQFSDGRAGRVRVTAIVPGPGNAPPTPKRRGHRAEDSAGCQPSQLLTALTSLGQSFEVSAGWPVALAVDVKDDCGNPFDSGTVSVSFSNGDPQIAMQNVKGGRWEGTWSTSNSAISQVGLDIRSDDSELGLHGESHITGALQSPTDPPSFTTQGVVSAAGGQSFVPLAPGAIISIYGDLLGESNLSASATPLPNTLVDTTVILAGEALPLFYVSPNQVNAVVPYDINVNTAQQIVIERGLTYSQPVAVNIAPAQPAIFRDGSTAPNQGIIIVVRGQGASQTQFEAKPGTPAQVGDVVVLYCAGLGSVNPAIPDGSAAGTPVPATSNSVQLTIGNQTASTLFSGLAPGFVGLYQVNAVVPTGVPSGDAVPVTISVAGQTSAPVVMAIH